MVDRPFPQDLCRFFVAVHDRDPLREKRAAVGSVPRYALFECPTHGFRALGATARRGCMQHGHPHHTFREENMRASLNGAFDASDVALLRRVQEERVWVALRVPPKAVSSLEN